MQRWILVCVAVALSCSVCSEASAWGFRSRSVSTTRTVTRYTGTPAQVAYAKAARMAELGARGHIGGGMAGCTAEGTGRGTTAAMASAACCFTGVRKCAACAVVKGRNGLYYAVKLYY